MPQSELALAPHPYAALLPRMGDDTAPPSYQRQRQRRAEILATARELMAEGEDAFTLRRVAQRSKVTVQTLRNSFGRRDELMVTALNEHTSAVWEALARLSTGPLLFLHLADAYGACARATPAFLRAMVTSALADAPALGQLQRHGAGIKAAHLRRMAAQGVLRAGVDTGALAAQITRLNTFTIYEWASGGDVSELRRELAVGNTLLLLGALCPEHAVEVEAWTPCALAA